jgi:hypothetical protein
MKAELATVKLNQQRWIGENQQTLANINACNGSIESLERLIAAEEKRLIEAGTPPAEA